MRVQSKIETSTDYQPLEAVVGSILITDTVNQLSTKEFEQRERTEKIEIVIDGKKCAVFSQPILVILSTAVRYNCRLEPPKYRFCEKCKQPNNRV